MTIILDPDYHDTSSLLNVNKELPINWAYGRYGGNDCTDLTGTCRDVCRASVYKTSNAGLVFDNGLEWFVEGHCNTDTGLCKCMIGNTCALVASDGSPISTPICH